tara:strand:- start:18 stop:953 length:936 start_codon:yes stop_codon:yes gene_type:complete
MFLFVTSSVHAMDINEFFASDAAQSICDDSMEFSSTSRREVLKQVKQFDQSIYFVFNHNSHSELRVFDLKARGEYTVKVDQNIVDIEKSGDQLYVLTKNYLEIRESYLGLLKKRIRTLPQNYPMQRHGHATGLVVKNNKAYISHGEMGAVIYDLDKEVFENIFFPSLEQPHPEHRSSMTDIAFDGSFFYFSFDNITNGQNDRAFEGVMIYDLNQRQVVKTIPVKQTMEAYSDPSLTIDGEDLYVTNWFLNFRHNIKKLMSTRTRYMLPDQRIWKYPEGKIVGKGFIKNSTLYGCYFNHRNNQLKSDSFKLK